MNFLKALLVVASGLLAGSYARAQYAPQAPLPGHAGIADNAPEIVAWADACVVNRGWLNIATPDSGFATVGATVNAVGPRDGYILSLGDSGVATLSFPGHLYDGPGPDFAVFENGFANASNPEEAFLELAFVEVSSDGEFFVRFPAHCLLQDTAQNGGSGLMTFSNASLLNNLAGKYIAPYGTPFDLADVATAPGLDAQHITHIRLVDAVGSIGPHAQHDTAGRAINDPYSTPFPSCGFDLDAVAAMHLAGLGVAGNASRPAAQIFPNPANDFLEIRNTPPGSQYRIHDAFGRLMATGALSPGLRLDARAWPAGRYIVQIQTSDSSWATSFVRF